MALADILSAPRPADAVLDRFFRAHPKMGARDRGTVIESVYSCLRHWRHYAWLAGTASPAPGTALAVHWLTLGISARALKAAGATDDVDGLAQRVRAADPATMPFAVRTDLPDWLVDQLRTRFGEAGTIELAQALNQPAPLDLRVNLLKAKRDAAQKLLAAEGIAAKPTPYSPFGLRIPGHAPLSTTSAFRDGLIEVQDEGSQLLALLVEPRRHEMVVDFCAGAGGKTLALGMLMNGQGTLYAFDVSEKRLARFKPRLKRSGLQNVRTVVIAHEGDNRVARLAGKIDRVLVDAPCSGTGTLRRHPEIKWRAPDLPALTATQARILSAAATLVKPGGRLVYATCSLLIEENEGIVSSFLATHPEFVQLPASDALARRHIEIETDELALRLYPHRHGTDGFFAALLERRPVAP